MITYTFRTVMGKTPGPRTRSLNLTGTFELEGLKITVSYVGSFRDGTSHTGTVTQSNTSIFAVGQQVTMSRSLCDISIKA